MRSPEFEVISYAVKKGEEGGQKMKRKLLKGEQRMLD